MEQDVSVMVNSIRREGVDRIIKLRKKKHGSTKDNDDLTLTQLKVQKGRLCKNLDYKRQQFGFKI